VFTAPGYREKFEKFLIDTLYFPDATPPEESPAEGRAKPGDKSVVFVPLKSGCFGRKPVQPFHDSNQLLYR
jgi:hypothetical protein